AGLLFLARVNSGDPTAGLNYELTAITAAILGGSNLFGGGAIRPRHPTARLGGRNLFGGRASVLGTLIGALVMGVLQNGLNLLAVSSFYQQMAIGTVVVLAVWLDQVNRARGQRGACSNSTASRSISGRSRSCSASISRSRPVR